MSAPAPPERGPMPVPVHRGKVRDVYDAGDGRLVVVASDRVSAFDVVMAEPVPDKGRVLTAVSAWWFERLAALAPNHLLATDLDALPPALRRPEWAGRVMLVRRLRMLPVECIVRGYLAGSAWAEYRRSGTIHGEPAPAGLRQADRLPEPRFTPSTKGTGGAHDENLAYAGAVALLGEDVAARARDLSLALYEAAAERCAERGLILADTKFELGFDAEGGLVVGDEVATPDSSRLWPADGWEPGTTPPAFDKQPLRDYLDGLDWDKQPPPPSLPAEVIDAMRDRYLDAYTRITGLDLADWPGAAP